MITVSLFLKEFSGNATMCETLDDVAALRRALLSESTDKELTAAAAALEAARAAYNKAAAAAVLADSDYYTAQVEVVRTAVHDWARLHKAAAFARWFEDNGKDVQTGIVDTPQRLASHVCALYNDFLSGSKVAKKKKKTSDQLKAAIAAKRAELAALVAQAEE